MKIAQLQSVLNQDGFFLEGIEPISRKERRKHIEVDDDYNFTANSAVDASSVSLWAKGSRLRWFDMDERAIKDEIKKIVDLVGFENLPTNEKEEAAKYNVGTVVQQRDAAPDEETLKVWGNRFGRKMGKARKKRSEQATTILFKSLKGILIEVAPSTFVPALLLVLSQMGNLLDLYELRGLVSLEEDAIEGIQDFLNGTAGTSFAGDGLKHKSWPLVSNSPYLDCNELAQELESVLITKGI